MTEPLIQLVTNEQVAAYREMLSWLAGRYNGLHGAEYDDLYQEGSLTIFLALRKGQHPSKDIVARRMLDYVNICARRGISHDDKGYADDLLS